jgi:long-chain acyl-CoA synthetase
MNDNKTDIISGLGDQAKAWLEREPATLPELFLRSAVEFDLKNALNYKEGDEWKPISAREFIERSADAAAALADAGINKGDRVAILSANCPQWTIADAGCQFAGVVDVPIYTTLGLDSVKYIINDSGSRLFFLQDAETYRRIEPILAECPTLEKCVIFSDETIAGSSAVGFSAFCTLGRT